MITYIGYLGSRVPGSIGFNVGYDLTPELPVEKVSGDGLLIVIVCRYDDTPVLDNASAWTLIHSRADSSGARLKMYFYGRMSDGTADDEDTGFSLTYSTVVSWATISISGVNDSFFPGGFASDRDYKSNSLLNLGACVKSPSTGNHVAIGVGLITTTFPGSASFTGMPSGYTQIGSTASFDYLQGADTVHSETAYSYKLLTSGIEDGGTFSDGAGSYGGGGTASAIFLIAYS